MRKNYWSKISWLVLGLVPLLLIACAGGTAAPATDEPVATTEPVATVETVVEEPTAEAMDVVEDVETEMEEEILTVAAKPQLIEFYADW